jgi:hypothetical protein
MAMENNIKQFGLLTYHGVCFHSLEDIVAMKVSCMIVMPFSYEDLSVKTSQKFSR